MSVQSKTLHGDSKCEDSLENTFVQLSVIDLHELDLKFKKKKEEESFLTGKIFFSFLLAFLHYTIVA
jgi:hypothetical protein